MVKKHISAHYGVRAFSPLTAMLIAPSQCGPDEMVAGFRPAPWWAYAPDGWIRSRRRHGADTAPLWGWFEVSTGKMEGVKQALICSSPAPGLGGWDREMLNSGCVPEDPRRQREQARTADFAAGGVGGLWAAESQIEMWEFEICLDEYWGGRFGALRGEIHPNTSHILKV